MKTQKIAYRVVSVNKKSGKRTYLLAHQTSQGAINHKNSVSWFYRNRLVNNYIVEPYEPVMYIVPSMYDMEVSK